MIHLFSFESDMSKVWTYGLSEGHDLVAKNLDRNQMVPVLTYILKMNL